MFNKIDPVTFSFNDFKYLKSYMEEYLTSDHPFRSGPVCPFMPAAIKRSAVSYFIWRGGGDLIESLEYTRNKYIQERTERNEKHLTYVHFFDKEYPIEDLLYSHYVVKPKFITSKIMVGVTYPENNAPSLRNKEYYPLRTPLPCIIYRALVAQDIEFLDPELYSIPERVEFLRSYIDKFSRGSRPDMGSVARARDLLKKYEGVE